MLRSAHKECVEAFEKGKTHINDLLLAAAKGKLDASVAEKDVRTIVHDSRIDRSTLMQTAQKCLEQAIELALDDGLLSHEEESTLAEYVERYSLDKDQLSRNQTYLRLVKAAILRDLLEGKVPTRVTFDMTIPVNFQKSERLIWLFQNVEYLQPRTHTTYQGRSSGVSFRVMKGVYYRTGMFSGNPIRTTEIATIDRGILAVTNKHLYFVGTVKSLRIPFSKIVAFQPYSDAIGIGRDGIAKQDIFKLNDGWFVYNLVSSLTSIH